MLTHEQIKSLVDKICDQHAPLWKDGCCDECSIYNFYNRSGHCAMRLYMDQDIPKVKNFIQQLKMEADLI